MKLFLLSPQPIFKARANGADAYAFPIRDLEYDTVTLGTYSDIWPNQTVFIGSTEGASDLGVTRVRALPDSHTLPVGLSSRGNHYGEINPVNDCYITILSDWRVWPKIPRIDGDGTRYMDGAMDWATYGQYSPPVAIAGAAVIATIDPDTEVITVDFDAGDSYTTHPGATIAAYGWAVGDGTIVTGTTSTAAITVEFPAGFRWVTVAIADSNSQFSYRHIPVLAIDPADDPCISNFTIERHTIRPDGQEMTVRIREDIPTATFPDNTLALVFEGEPVNAADRSNLVMMGWLTDEPAEIEGTDTGTLKDVTLQIVDVAGRLKSLPAFPDIIEETDDPSKWGEMEGLNMDRFFHFLLKWQSTVLDLADWFWSGTTTTYPAPRLISEGNTNWENIARKANDLIPAYALTVDTKGTMRILPDPLFLPVADRTSTVQASLDANDYSNLNYTQQRHPRVSWVRTHAIIADGSGEITIKSIAPGTAPGWGSDQVDDGEALVLSQNALNIYTGHRYARLNAPQGLFRLTLAEGSRQGIEPALMTWVQLTIPATAAAQRGLSFTNERGLVQQIDVRYASTRTGLTKTYTLSWERETSGTPGVTVIVEPAKPVNPTDPLVPPVVTAPPSFDGGIYADSDKVALIGDGGEIFRTSNFTANPPTWETYDDHIPDFGGAITVHSFVVDPFSPLYRGTGTTVRGYLATGGGVWRLDDIFGTASATQLYDYDHSISFSRGRWRTIAASFGRYFPDESDNPWIMVATNYADNTSGMGDGTHIIYSLDAGATWSEEIEVTGHNYYTPTASGYQMRPGLWLSPRTPGYAIVGAPTEIDDAHYPQCSSYITTDWGATWTQSDLLDMGQGHGNVIHVPWHNNADESLIFWQYRASNIGIYNYLLVRTGAGGFLISPEGFAAAGPRHGPFGVRTYDLDRRYVVTVGFSKDNSSPGDESDESSAVFYSTDGGESWTTIVDLIAAAPNQTWPMEAAFSADDPAYIYIWGNEAYIQVYDHGTVYNKRGALAPSGLERVVGLVGG